jgi:hypothetical protein
MQMPLYREHKLYRQGCACRYVTLRRHGYFGRPADCCLVGRALRHDYPCRFSVREPKALPGIHPAGADKERAKYRHGCNQPTA